VELSSRVQLQTGNPAYRGAALESHNKGVNAAPDGDARESVRAGVSSAQVDQRSKIWQEARVDVAAKSKALFDSFPEAVKTFGMICGTPASVIPRLRVVMETLRPGVFILWQNDGRISRQDRENSLKLLSAEVMPGQIPQSAVSTSCR
jgi:hypothetical protein